MQENKITTEEFLEYLRTHMLVIGDWQIQYKGENIDTINGRYEMFTIVHKLPFYEEKEEIDKSE